MKKEYLDSFGKGINTPIKTSFLASQDGVSDLLNIDIEGDYLVKRKGWKTFKSMVNQLDELNKKYKRLKQVGDFTIRLPIRGSK